MKEARKVKYLVERNGWYWFKRAVPAALQAAFGQDQVWKSLGTRDLALAEELLPGEVTAFDAAMIGVRQEMGTSAQSP